MTEEERKVFESMDPVHLLALTIYGEARGESRAGKRAVAKVIMNRMDDPRWGNTVAAVVLQRFQFSCFNGNDPNFPILLQVARHSGMRKGPKLAECMGAATEVWLSPDDFGVDGANHYHTTNIKPSWAKNMLVVATIGRHVFLKG